MLNINSSLIGELNDKAYRDAYVGSQIRMTLPLQIRGLRESLKWTQSKLAKEAKMAQPRISELESPGERRLTIETLLRLASAFDVALQVRFVPFGKLVDWSESLDLDNFSVQPFPNELEDLKIASFRHAPARHRRRRRERSTAQVSVRIGVSQRTAQLVKPITEKRAHSASDHPEVANSPIGPYAQLRMFPEQLTPSDKTEFLKPNTIPAQAGQALTMNAAFQWASYPVNNLGAEGRINYVGGQGTTSTTTAAA